MHSAQHGDDLSENGHASGLHRGTKTALEDPASTPQFNRSIANFSIATQLRQGGTRYLGIDNRETADALNEQNKHLEKLLKRSEPPNADSHTYHLTPKTSIYLSHESGRRPINIGSKATTKVTNQMHATGMRNSKFIRPLSVAAVLAMIAATSACGVTDGAETQGLPALRIATTMEPSAPTVACGTSTLEEELDGEFNVSVYPSSQMGSTTEASNSASSGDLEMVIAGPSEYAHHYSPIAVVDANYLYEDMDQFVSVMNSETGIGVQEGFLDASNLRIMSVWNYGARHFTSNIPIRTPDDMAKVTTRVPTTAGAQVEAIVAMGPNTVPVDFGELYVALSQGVVTAQENPIPTIEASGFMEVQSHLNLTSHQIGTHMPAVNNDWHESLTAEQKSALDQAMDRAAESVDACVKEREEEYVAQWRDEGITIVEDIDNEEFRSRVSDHLRTVFKGEDRELYEQLLSETS